MYRDDQCPTIVKQLSYAKPRMIGLPVKTEWLNPSTPQIPSQIHVRAAYCELFRLPWYLLWEILIAE